MDLFIGQQEKVPTPVINHQPTTFNNKITNIKSNQARKQNAPPPLANKTYDDQRFNYDDALERALQLEKQKEEAILNKRKKEVLDKALLMAEKRKRTIEDLMNSKELKRNFEANYADNKFGFNYQNNPQIHPNKRSVSQQPYQQNPYAYYQMYYLQQQQYQQLQAQQNEMLRQKAQHEAAQEALEQIKLMQLEPMRQLRDLQNIQDKLQGNAGTVNPLLNQSQQYNPNAPYVNYQASSPPSFPLQQNMNHYVPSDPLQYQQIYHNQSPLKINQSLQAGQNLNDSISNYINIQRPQSQPQMQLQQIQQQPFNDQMDNGNDYMDHYLSLKYQPNQHMNPHIRLIADARTNNFQAKDLTDLEKRKRKILLEFQNMKKKYEFAQKTNQNAQQQNLVQQNSSMLSQEQEIQQALAAQQQLIMQLMNGMNVRKEEDVRIKNQQLLKRIKQYDKKNRQMKKQVNKTILMQLGGGDPNNLQGFDQLLMESDEELSDGSNDI